ncbi:FAST kinase domain-containing protein 4 [Ambystoma mexicanum]|uniref:FAST kinase domain-containing protein 4 n=1 Tax=Ambystoma mexicanum TaxID=8296 RepID=UPI0037E90841
MASRLAHRCARLLGASLLAPVSALACTLASRNGPPRTLAFSLVHTSSLCMHKDPLMVKEQAYPKLPDRTEIDELIETASGAEDLLQICLSHHVSGNQAALIMVALSRLAGEKRMDTSSILQDERCRQLLQSMEKQLSQVWNGNLVTLLRSLYLLRLEDGKVLRSVENEMHWRLRRLSFKQLVLLADYCGAFAQTQEQKGLVCDVVKHLELRWTEIEDVKTVVILMTKVGYISQSLMEKLEDKALEYAEHFSPDETRRVLLALAAQKRRSVPLLRALSYHLVQRHMELSTAVLLDVAYAFGQLNFQQAQVYQKMASDLLPKVPEMIPSDVARCVKSMAYLKWLNLPLFEAFTEYVMDNAQKFTVAQICNIVLAFGHLNYQPSKGEAFFDMVHKRLLEDMDALDPLVQVDLVWSLCMLQQVNDMYLKKVLQPEFYIQVLADKSLKARNYRLKLVYINASARLEYAGYPGPFLPSDVVHAEVSQQVERKLTPLQSGLTEALKAAVGDACVRHAVATVYGWQMDGEVVLDTENKPLAINELVAPHLLKPTGKQPLPSGAKRIAFLCWDFSSFSAKSKDLLGRYALSRRHLQAAGFLIVDVPFYEWLDLKSGWLKVAYLKDKMGKAVAEEMAK